MPVSEPSYFPPNRGNLSVVGLNAGTKSLGAQNFLAGSGAGNNSTSNKLIIIGNFSGSAGIVGPDGMILIGNDTLTENIEVAGNGLAPLIIGTGVLATCTEDVGGVVIIGNSVLSDSTGAATDIVIVGSGVLDGAALGPLANITVMGSGTLKNCVTTICGSLRGVVCVGNDIAANLDGNVNNVNLTLIGAQAASRVTEATSLTVIGSSALLFSENSGNAAVIGELAAQIAVAANNSVVVGPSCGAQLTSIDNSVVIGADAANSTTTNLNECVIIGTAAGQYLGSTGGTALTMYTNVIIGFLAGANMAGSNNVIIGGGCADTDTFLQLNSSVIIGAWAGDFSNLGSLDNQLLIEVGNTGTSSANSLMWGNFAQGGIVLGHSTADQRELDGADSVNIVKIIAGTKGAGAPVGGGYFYVAGANNSIHWLNSAGVDSILSDNAQLETLILSAAAPAAGAGQVALGATTATAATAGAHGAAPNQVAGYLVANVAGTTVKIPYYAN
jgi:hypothetical protein